ncbi:hypothetical protein RND81_14G157500 [Saponaria officinalis]|uniref:Avr9/Cf-9 rapidly elicited protein 146 n=1 Tax=Saponaria officinalis TaxID=3572 RepID=A0AAW1GR93_SAPOF
MEQNTPLMAKKIWNIMRVAFFMLRKGICKRKILLDLNLAMKRGKIAGKALQNLMFHHHNHHGNHHDSISKVGLDGQSKPQGEYEFSCSNTPLYRQYFTTNKRSKNHHDKNYSIEDVNNMFDMMMLNSSEEIVAASPVSGLRSGLGFHSTVKQLRITDSPFPLQSGENNGDRHVDEAAAEFIKRFYSQLKQEKYY